MSENQQHNQPSAPVTADDVAKNFETKPKNEKTQSRSLNIGPLGGDLDSRFMQFWNKNHCTNTRDAFATLLDVADNAGKTDELTAQINALKLQLTEAKMACAELQKQTEALQISVTEANQRANDNAESAARTQLELERATAVNPAEIRFIPSARLAAWLALETEQIIKLCTTDAEKAAFSNNPSATTLLYILTAVAKRGTTAICPTCKY